MANFSLCDGVMAKRFELFHFLHHCVSFPMVGFLVATGAIKEKYGSLHVRRGQIWSFHSFARHISYGLMFLMVATLGVFLFVHCITGLNQGPNFKLWSL